MTKHTIQYWLLKSEPSTYSIDHLKHDRKTAWTGIRNYQARNFIRDQMQKGDICLYYHSNTKPDATGIVGLAKVSSDWYLDPTSFDPKSQYFEKNKKIQWVARDITYMKKYRMVLTLNQIKSDKRLTNMLVAQKGSRLSVQPVTKRDFDYIVSYMK